MGTLAAEEPWGWRIISRSCSGRLEPEGYTSQVTPRSSFIPAGRWGARILPPDQVTPRAGAVQEARYQPEDLRRMAEENH